jgi:tetratricopeptide (TPR) repeat protein
MKTLRIVALFGIVAITILLAMSSYAGAPVKGYDGPDLPRDKVAIIERSRDVEIESFDGQKSKGLWNGVALVPGFHAIEASFRDIVSDGWSYWSVNNSIVRFNAEAGHTYKIEWEHKNDAHSYWGAYAVDMTTGKRTSTPDLASATQAVEQNPDNPYAYHARAAAHSLLRNYQDAKKDLDKTIELNPTSGIAYYDRAVIYVYLSNYEQALRDFDKNIDLTPKLAGGTHAFTYYLRGYTNYKLKDYPQAIKDFTKALELNGKLALAYNYRGVVYGLTDNPELAVKDWLKAMDIQPEFAPPPNNYSWLLATYKDAKYRDGKKAVRYGEKAVSIAEKNNDDDLMKCMCYGTLAAAYAESGDFGRAVEMESKAYKLNKPVLGSDKMRETSRALLEAYKNKKTYLQWKADN